MRFPVLLFLLSAFSFGFGKDGDGSVTISGELKAWHAVTLTLSGPFAKERDTDPNPFTDYRFSVQFTHESGLPSYTVPGYFAADGNAAESGAEEGNCWRAHLSPDAPGKWEWRAEIRKREGKGFATLTEFSKSGSFTIAESDKSIPDFRARGRLTYIGERYLQFVGDKTRFLKADRMRRKRFLPTPTSMEPEQIIRKRAPSSPGSRMPEIGNRETPLGRTEKEKN